MRERHPDATRDETPCYRWSRPLLESLLRFEAVKAESIEMSDWYIALMEKVQEDFGADGDGAGCLDLRNEAVGDAVLRTLKGRLKGTPEEV
jgi:hypothetical protein